MEKMTQMKCKICGCSSGIFERAIILEKYDICYYRCEYCDFIQTEEPYWLAEAYSSAITKSDIGLISRNVSFAELTRNLIVTCLDPKDVFIDYGGGYGLFTRLMRDKGFDFFHFDPKCQNIFSQGFDAQPDKEYSLLTAWEVLEHLVDPLNEIKIMLTFSHLIFCSTMVLPPSPKPLHDWWYYGLEHGQHLSFYSSKTLDLIAQKNNLSVVYTDGNIHLLADKTVNPMKVRIGLDKKLRLFRRLVERSQPDSLIDSDFLKITGKILE